MTNLSERVMSLSGPDREVDAEIAQQFGFIPPDYERAVEHGEVRLFWWHKTDDHEPYWVPPSYTASIDAAMTLVDLEVGAHGEGHAFFPYIERASENLGGSHFWSVTLARSFDRWRAEAATPALALCAAALLAREASNGDL